MKMSEHGEQLLMEWEGFRTHVYYDSAHLKTIGVGHLLTKDELSSGKIWIDNVAIKYGYGLTDKQVEELLAQDLSKYEAAVNEAVTVELSQNQFDALVSFCFNVGIHAFKSSTLVKVLNQGHYQEVPVQLRRWVYSGGVRNQGLMNRREKEITLWNLS